MSQVQKCTLNEFSKTVLTNDLPVVVDLYADWCGPCRALAPLLEIYAQAYGDRIDFVKVNVDEEPEIAEYYQANSIPTLLFFQQGQLVHRTAGIPDAHTFQTLLNNLASKNVVTPV